MFNSERPSLVSNISYLKECYLVPVDEIQVDPQFQEVEQEEILTEDVQIYIPKDKAEQSSFSVAEQLTPEASVKDTVKKSEELSEKDFSPGPYNSIELTELEFGDSITSTPHSKSAYEVIAVNKEYATAICLYHQALPGRVGEQYTFANPYLVEKCNQEMLVTA